MGLPPCCSSWITVTVHDVPPLHRQLTKDLIEYLSMVHLRAHVRTRALENTQRRAFNVHVQVYTKSCMPIGIYSTSASFNVMLESLELLLLIPIARTK